MDFVYVYVLDIFFFSSRRRHTRSKRDWSSDVCSSDLGEGFIKKLNGIFAIALWDQKEEALYLFRDQAGRSEERRVGKECRSRWWQDHYKKKVVNRVGLGA